MSKKIKIFYENIIIGFQTDAGKWVGKGFWVLCLAIGTNVVLSAWRGYSLGAEFDTYKTENDIRWMQNHKLDSMRNQDLHNISQKVESLNTKQDLMMQFFGIKQN